MAQDRQGRGRAWKPEQVELEAQGSDAWRDVMATGPSGLCAVAPSARPSLKTRSFSGIDVTSVCQRTDQHVRLVQAVSNAQENRMNLTDSNLSTPAASTWVEVLRGGDKVLIRPIHPADATMEKRFIEGLSPTSRRFRFQASMQSPSDDLLRQMTAIDPLTDVAYVAVIDAGGVEQQVGAGRLSITAGGSDCEFALVVADKWQRKGLGTHLMHHLVMAARAKGLDRMYSSDARDNTLMRRFAAHLRLDHECDPADSRQVLYSLGLATASVAQP
jgi:acetyltransferase